MPPTAYRMSSPGPCTATCGFSSDHYPSRRPAVKLLPPGRRPFLHRSSEGAPARLSCDWPGSCEAAPGPRGGAGVPEPLVGSCSRGPSPSEPQASPTSGSSTTTRTPTRVIASRVTAGDGTTAAVSSVAGRARGKLFISQHFSLCAVTGMWLRPTFRVLFIHVNP